VSAAEWTERRIAERWSTARWEAGNAGFGGPAVAAEVGGEAAGTRKDVDREGRVNGHGRRPEPRRSSPEHVGATLPVTHGGRFSIVRRALQSAGRARRHRSPARPRGARRT
jgi:hypothetical protein